MKTARDAGQRKSCHNNGDERSIAVHNKLVQLQKSYGKPQANGWQLWSFRSTFCSLPRIFIFFIYSFFLNAAIHLSFAPSIPPTFPVFLCCGSLTRRVKCVFAVVYRQDVTAIRSNPICFQISGAQRTKRQDNPPPLKKKKRILSASTANTHFCLVVHKTQKCNKYLGNKPSTYYSK